MQNRLREPLKPGGSIVRFYYSLNPLLFDFPPFSFSIKRRVVPLTFPHSKSRLLPVVDFVSIPPPIYSTLEAILWPLAVCLCTFPLSPGCSCSTSTTVADRTFRVPIHIHTLSLLSPPSFPSHYYSLQLPPLLQLHYVVVISLLPTAT